VKNPDQVVAAVQAAWTRSWPTIVLTGHSDTWPLRIALGTPAKATVESDFPAVQRWALSWQEWAATRPVSVDTATRLVHGTRQPLPSHVNVATFEDGLHLLGAAAQDTVLTAKARVQDLMAVAAPGSITEKAVRQITEMTDVDFQMLLAAVPWLRTHDPAGLTPRQVPIPGIHGKWLNTREAMLAALAGRESFGFRNARPARVHFTYLDPDYVAAGGRRFDVHTAGDNDAPAYTPEVVVISENKDTAVVFPPLAGGIAVEGSGYSAHARHVPWIRQCRDVVYWGDMDADGLAIVNMYREAGMNVRTILMDVPAFEEFTDFGTRTMANGEPIQVDAKHLPHLTAAEQELYDRLTDPSWGGPLRIEQERIPLPRAHQLVVDARTDHHPAAPS